MREQTITIEYKVNTVTEVDDSNADSNADNNKKADDDNLFVSGLLSLNKSVSDNENDQQQINNNETLFSIIIKELYYVDALYGSKHNKGVYRNLLQNYTRDNSDMDGRLDDTSDVTTTGKNTCGYVKAPVHSQALCEEKLVGASQVKDIENKYKTICDNRARRFDRSLEPFTNSKPALHLQVLAFNILTLGLIYGYVNRKR